MADIDIAQLVADLKDAATAVLKKDVTALRGFSGRQVEAIAQQAKLVGVGIATGEITEATRDFFLDSLEDMTRNFVRTLRGVTMVTVEKVWNAMVTVVWKALSKATGLALAMPIHV